MIERKNNEVDSGQYIIKIMGEEYLIRGNDARQYVDEITIYIEEVIKTIAGNNLKLNKSQVAVLAALKVADELHKIRQEYQYLKHLLKEAE